MPPGGPKRELREKLPQRQLLISHGYDQSVWVLKKIVSDNATNFTSKANELLAQKLGVHHTTITPYNPAANGQVERINALIIQTLRFYVDRNATNWTYSFHMRPLQLTAQKTRVPTFPLIFYFSVEIRLHQERWTYLKKPRISSTNIRRPCSKM